MTRPQRLTALLAISLLMVALTLMVIAAQARRAGSNSNDPAALRPIRPAG
jgi:hypothetical protein